MAVRDGDVALWLHNKLGSTDDLWSGKSIRSQLSREKLQGIQECFHNLQPHVKVKLMLSFLHLHRRNTEEWRMELDDILELAVSDSDQWVAMVAEILRPYPSTGCLCMDVDDSNTTFHEVLADLKKIVRKSADVGMLPMECVYLSKNALTSVAGQQPLPVKHFALKRKPKSAALRAELLQKSNEAANTGKKNPGSHSSLPIKVRSFAKKMDDSTPLKGIPQSVPPRTPTSAGFRSPTTTRFGGTPIGQRTPLNRKEGGIKLLDIGEMPVGAKEAKRRRRQAEMEAAEQQKKEKEVAVVTPDYAAGLVAPVVTVSTTSSTSSQSLTAGPSYTPLQNSARLPSANTGGTTTLPTTSISAATQAARENLQAQLQQQLGQSQIRTQIQTVQQPSQPTTQPNTVQITPQPAAQAIPAGTPVLIKAQTANSNPPKRGLSLTREQMLEAQEMFRTSNRVTRPEKALILGFMAGSRENPCPQQGDIVNIRLSETSDSIQQPDGTFRPMMIDTFFQMNYKTGEWKRIKKFRDMEAE